MAYEIRYTEVEIPEVDAFLREYKALCEKHGMAIEAGSYGYDGGHYTTIGKPNDPQFNNLYLNMDGADKEIPCIAAAFERAKAISEAKYRQTKKAASR